jgi:hypothetical protein
MKSDQPALIEHSLDCGQHALGRLLDKHLGAIGDFPAACELSGSALQVFLAADEENSAPTGAMGKL